MIPMNSIKQTLITIQIGRVQNPVGKTASSYFKVRTLYNNVIIDSNEVFGSLTFSNPPVNSVSATL